MTLRPFVLVSCRRIRNLTPSGRDPSPSRRTRGWPVVNVGGMLAGLFAGFAVAKIVPWLAPTDFPSGQALGLVGAVAGIVYGAVTWPFLAQLRLRADPAPRNR